MKFSEFWQRKSHMFRKMWINQFAFSLFGLFVASALSGKFCILAGVFSFLFYMSVIGYAVIDDAQKDKIIYNAGRGDGLSVFSGLKYAYISFVPTIIISVLYTLFTFVRISEELIFILGLFVKYLFAGQILGIDVGLTNYTYDAVNQIRISNASDTVLFLSNHGVFQLLFVVIVPAIAGLIYYLGFSGKISFNTTDNPKKK